MKKYLFIFAAVALFASCSKELQNDKINNVPEQQGLVTVSFDAVVEDIVDADTKAAVSTSGVFSWTNGDVIAVQLEDDTFANFTYSSSTGKFTASLSKAIKDGGVAYYPSTIAINGTPGSVALPASYTAAAATSGFPMIASVSLGATTLSFTHLGGILSLRASHVPADATKLVLTVPSVGITGTFAVSSDNISAGASASSVTLTFSAGSFGTSATEFFIPVPVTTFTSGFTMEFKNASDETLYTKSTARTNIAVGRAQMKRMKSFTVPVSLYICSSKPWGESTEYAYVSDDVASWPGTSYDPDTKPFTHGSNSYTRVIEDLSAAGSSTNMIFNVNYSDSNDAPWYDPYGKLYRAMLSSVDITNDVYISLSLNNDGTHKILLRNWSDNGYMDTFNSWYYGGDAILGAYPGTSIASMSTVVYDSETFPYYSATANKKIGVQAVYAAQKDWNHTNADRFIDNLNQNYLVTFKNNDTDPHVFGFPDVVVTID